MDFDTDRTRIAEKDAPEPRFQPTPFLTILDEKPAAGKRAPRKVRDSVRAAAPRPAAPRPAAPRPAAPRPAAPKPAAPKPKERAYVPRKPAGGRGGLLSKIRKGAIRIQSYAAEWTRKAAAAAASGFSGAVKSAGRGFISSLARAASAAAGAAKSAARGRTAKPPKAAVSAPPATAIAAEERPARRAARPHIRFDLRALSERLSAFRPSSHKTVKFILPALIAAIGLTASTAAIVDARKFPVAAGNLLLPDEDSAQTALMNYLEPDESDKDDLPAGALPPMPVTVSMRSYTARKGDTLDKLARRFGLRQDTIISANNLQSAGAIHQGVTLRIPSMNGVSHKVRKGDSLSSIAKAYAIDVTQIVDANNLESGTLSAGQSVFIPNARLPASHLRNFYGERFIWPARGPITSPFGFRENPFTGLRTYHSAIDIAVSLGTQVKATNEGKVADIGYNSVFGNYIILKHANGYQSLYGHLSHISVREGTSVQQGSVIGLSGNTGQSTGPHLHFSIFKNGQALDPRKYVK